MFRQNQSNNHKRTYSMMNPEPSRDEENARLNKRFKSAEQEANSEEQKVKKITFQTGGAQGLLERATQLGKRQEEECRRRGEDLDRVTNLATNGNLLQAFGHGLRSLLGSSEAHTGTPAMEEDNQQGELPVTAEDNVRRNRNRYRPGGSRT